MNVSVKQISAQMKKQMDRLEQAIDRSDKQTVKESVAIIEAYCQLLKDEKAQSQPVSQPQVRVESTSPSIVHAPSKPYKEKENSGSLLDF
ncbi:DUF5327 family protein [Bacillus solitudinis]|uniref:DUF5327 family protein n=1 Tax=Bacillus solitudinis TaxID=2014074 RepID=UPI000C23D885|nr:DUF5327 family protein [Bacillus solitudinis]